MTDWIIFVIKQSDVCSEPEQILIRPAKDNPKAPKSESAHTVTIIPTGCVGTSSLTRVLPSIIEFKLPGQEKDGGMGSRLDHLPPTSCNIDTYLVFSPQRAKNC